MKTKLLLTLCLIASLYNYGQNVNIPDANFKSALLADTNINTNGDGEIQLTEASAFTGSIVVNSSSIQDLTGIEAFTSLTMLSCRDNQLTSLDVSANVALTAIDCANNQLTMLDLSANTALSELIAFNNDLISIDVSNNTSLVTLSCSLNQLTSLDLSSNTALEFIYFDSNQLTSLNVANGNNNNVTNGGFTANNNPNLTCIQVDDVAYSNTNWTNIDAQTSFSANCTPCIVNIPDANFKSYLVGNTAINTNGDAEIQCSEASAFTGLIQATGLNISDFTGIEAFTNIIELNIENNNATSLDLSNNTALLTVNCQNNDLTSLDVTNNIALTNLNCNTNDLASIDISNNIALTQLRCGSNQMTSIDVSANTGLVFLYAGINQLTSIDIVNNTLLEVLNLRTNQLTNLLVTNNTNLESLTAFSNQLTTLDLSSNVLLQELIISDNNLIGLDLSLNTNLIFLQASSNNLTNLNVANGNNANFSNPFGPPFDSRLNPSLSCIQVDSGFTPPATWQKDATASYSDDCSNLSVDEFTINAVSLYPNPTTNTLNIKMNSSLKQATIYSVLGQDVLITQSTVINTANLKTGMYLIKIEDETGRTVTKRFIKQ